MLLDGKIAVVTGAARGLGLACAASFAEQGAKVIISDIQDEQGEAAAEDLRATGADVCYRHCDVAKKSEVEALVQFAVVRHGRLDTAVANAGIVHISDALQLEEDDLDRVLSVNLKGVIFTGQLAARQMVTQQPDANGAKGTIINMSSVNGVLAIPEIAPYVIAKGGVNQWTKVLALRLAQEAVRVNAIGPGSIATELFAAVASDPEKYRTIMSRTPMGRPGRPEEIGKIAVFLAGDQSSYITGQTIYPDGGRLALNYTVPVPE
ncbi:MAG: glucose 1-dehydrogenase [Gammaproteobacteria bacterium]|nr:glucose 1-dehydrogenase [Gammaproteobacteria bacterium]